MGITPGMVVVMVGVMRGVMGGVGIRVAVGVARAGRPGSGVASGGSPTREGGTRRERRAIVALEAEEGEREKAKAVDGGRKRVGGIDGMIERRERVVEIREAG